MFADHLGVEEWACVEESEMGCSEKGLNWRAEESLVHVLDPVLDVCNCVDVVGLMWHVYRHCRCVECGSGRVGSGHDGCGGGGNG